MDEADELKYTAIKAIRHITDKDLDGWRNLISRIIGGSNSKDKH